MNALEIRGLTKHFADFTLDNLNLILPGGCILGLIGENGAGKSTLLSVLSGCLKAQEGKVKNDGAKVCLLPQNPDYTFQNTLET